MKAPNSQVDVMRPKPSPAPLIRIGGDSDGAYLVPDDLQGVKSCFSPGVSNRKDFEDELLTNYGIECHMCDFTSDVDKFRTPLMSGQTFKKKWLDINNNADSISLSGWVDELAPYDDDLILQIDIEGAEYRNLLNTPESTLLRFRIIIIELHNLYVFNKPEEFNKEVGPLLALLDKHFICVHAHPNNCGGDIILSGSKLNIPNIHELTFLRRDRWEGVSEEDYHPSVLPHPLDIEFNVPNKPPLYLNEHWLDSQKRTPESSIKMLNAQVDYLTSALKKAEDLADSLTLNVVTDLHRLAQYSSSLLPSTISANSLKDQLIDVAAGKKFFLSSNYNGYPKTGVVSKQEPFFFSSDIGRNQYITIDLGSEYCLHELKISNRSNICQERARCLFYCTHNEVEPDLKVGLPVSLDMSFLESPGHASITDLRGCTARYLTIFSPETTYLHFSAIEIMGL